MTMPANLRCEYREDPVGIDTDRPRFSWNYTHFEKGQSQTAYQILVADDPESLGKGTGDVWDSGRVESFDTVNIPFNGQRLKSHRRYFWCVRWWDADNRASSYSSPASFVNGFLPGTEWQADWISMTSPESFVTPVRLMFQTGNQLNFTAFTCASHILSSPA